VDLPGYGLSSKGVGEKANFLRAFLRTVHALDAGSKVVVVTASMGGGFGLPFIMEDRGQSTAGYVTVAGLTSAFAQNPSLVLDTPALIIYGSEDSMLRGQGPQLYKEHFPNSAQVIFQDAPHPAYLKDLSAAQRFSALVLAFAQGVGKPAAVWSQSSGMVAPKGEGSSEAMASLGAKGDLLNLKSANLSSPTSAPSSSSIGSIAKAVVGMCIMALGIGIPLVAKPYISSKSKAGRAATRKNVPGTRVGAPLE